MTGGCGGTEPVPAIFSLQSPVIVGPWTRHGPASVTELAVMAASDSQSEDRGQSTDQWERRRRLRRYMTRVTWPLPPPGELLTR